MKLVKFSTGKLEEAEKKVAMLVKDSEGKHTQVPFDPEEEKDTDGDL
jgi:exodeoxyribonuclease VII small subunit